MATLTSPQIGTTQKVVSSNLAGGVVVMPFIAEVAAGASGEIAMLQTSAVSITGIDEIFTYIMDVSHAVAILNAFTITDTDEINPRLTDGSGANVSLVQDDAGAFAGSKPGFKAALIAALEDASSNNNFQVVGQDEATSVKVNPQGYLEIQSYKDTLRHLQYDTIANLLTAADLFSFKVVLDTSGGAENMWNAIGDTEPRSVAYRKSLFTQISEDRIEKYLMPSEGAVDVSNSRLQTLEGVKTLNFLPLVQGDKMVFVFDATVGEAADYTTGLNVADSTVMPTSGAKLSRVTVDALPASGLANVNNTAGITTLSSADNLADGISLTAPTKRRFAIEITLAGDGLNPEMPAGTTGKGFRIMDLSAGNVESGYPIFDPANPDYRLMIAAGLIPVEHGFVLTAEPAVSTGQAFSADPLATFPPSIAAVYIDVSGVDPSGGWEGAGNGAGYQESAAIITDLQTILISNTNAPNVSSWLVVNAPDNINRFVYTEAGTIVYQARAATGDHTDTARVYAVSNAGRHPDSISGILVQGTAGIGPAPAN